MRKSSGIVDKSRPNLLTKVIKFLKRLSLFLACLIIGFALLVSLIRALTPFVAKYQSDVESQLSVLIGKPVHIGHLETGWYWWYPVVALKDIQIGASDNHPIHLKQVKVGLDIVHSLWQWQWKPGLIYIDGLKLTVIQHEKTIEIPGLGEFSTTGDSQGLFDFSLVPKWLLKHSTINLNLQEKPAMVLKNVSAVFRQDVPLYRFRFHAHVNGTAISGMGKWLAPLGDFYLTIHHAMLEKWQAYTALLTPGSIKAGMADIELWFSLNHMTIKDVVGRVRLQNLAFEWKKQMTLLPYVSTNFGFEATDTGFSLKANDFNLITRDMPWPKNSLSWQYNKATKAHNVFVAHLDLGSFFNLIKPFYVVKPMPTQPLGELNALNIHFTPKGLTYLLTKFDHIHWPVSATWPGVSGLSGSLQWLPTDGRLQLDSQDVLLSMKGLNPETISSLKADMNWQFKEGGLIAHLLQLTINSKTLTAFVEGDMDVTSKHFNGVLNLDASDVQHWLKWLPSNKLKPKLAAWLKNDIKRIDALHVQGRIQDSGQTNLQGKLSGVDLFFNKAWPIVKGIDADLVFADRALTANIHQAQLGNIPVKNLHLVADKLGTSKETLAIQGEVHTHQNQALAYVLETPLPKKIPVLRNLELPKNTKGQVDLSLNLMVLLYPIKDDLNIKGHLTFKDNVWLLNALMGKLPLNQLSGFLNFSEKGLLNSQLKTQLFEIPMTIDIPNEADVNLHLKGNTTVENIAKHWPLPYLSTIHGPLSFNGVVQLDSHTQALKSVQLNTIFEKYPDAGAAFQFSPQSDAQYNFEIKQAYLQGKGELSLKPLKLYGQFEHVIIPPSFDFNHQTSQSLKALDPSSFPQLDLSIKEFNYKDMSLGEAIIKAHPVPHQWVIDEASLNSDAFNLTLQGDWKKDNQTSVTSIVMEAKTRALDKTLKALKISPVAEALKGKLQFKGGWDDPITAFSLKKLKGDVFFSMSNGRITEFNSATEDKLDFGRVLSLLSLQTIPRRLRLDFSDLMKDGFSFDKCEGNFTLKDGVLETQNTYIVGPVAYAGLKGKIDLLLKQYDLEMNVSPYITSSLPLVAAIAGGPVLGVATYVASKIINRGMQKMDVYTYSIQGSWVKPVVKRLSMLKKWQGINGHN